MTDQTPEQDYAEGQNMVEGRFLDGKLELLLCAGVEAGPGYAVALHDYRIWRNGEYVGDALRLSYDRDALGWWISYVTWRGSPLDVGARS